MRKPELVKKYNELNRIRLRHDALFFNELRRFFREELILILALKQFSVQAVLDLIQSRRSRLISVLTPLYQQCALDFYSYQLTQKSMINIPIITKEAIESRAEKIVAYSLQLIRTHLEKDIITQFYSSNNRPMRIAKTESTTAAQIGLNEAAISSGPLYTKKTWVSDPESQRHGQLSGTTVKINSAFPNGLMYPGDPNGSADQTVQCRCFVVYT